MPKRDWQKDWELCQKAKCTNFQDRNGALTPFMQVPALNAYHIQLMREALEAIPYWLQRVRGLEAQVNELRAEVREWICDECRYVFPQMPIKEFNLICQRCGKGAVVPKMTWENSRLSQRIEQLEAENCRLKAVAKAAKLVVDEWMLPGKPMMEAPIRHLQETLAALEGGKENA